MKPDRNLEAAKPPLATRDANLRPCWLKSRNRRMRTRMYGGVTGKAGDSLPMSIWSVPAERSGDGALDCAELPLKRNLIFVENFQFVSFETVDCFHLGWLGRAFKPTCRAPGILVGHVYQAVSDWILMHIV